MISVDNFEKQINNIKYKNETYSARDNGAVMRHPNNIDFICKVSHVSHVSHL